MNGFLVVDKPGGITSHDVIDRCRRLLGVRRIGHAGTLDPMATGVLVVGVGRATRLLRFVESEEKGYVAELTFGTETDTLDATGTVVAEHDASGLTRASVEQTMESFVGDVEQVPPMASAVKVGGERLYKKARRGEEVERAPRTVTIPTLELLRFENPVAEVRVVCSKGTYVRALAADIGSALGTGAHLSALRRTRVGALDLSHAVALDDVSAETLRPMEEAVARYPRLTVGDDAARALVQGKSLPPAGIAGPIAVFGPGGLVAMAEDRGEELRSLCVLTG
ncbi:MAG: tRNA pseudouridine(55) synthase TruB [Actinomycetota bacterium]